MSGQDRGDGSRTRPWRSITYAARRVRPGDTVHVAAGNYSGPLRIQRGGSRRSNVRFVSDSRWRARLSVRGSGSVTVVEIRANHVTFEGFDVTGSGSDGTAGINVEGSHVTVARNRVHDLLAPCLESGNGTAGIVIGGGLAGYRNRGGRVDGNQVVRIGSGGRDGSCRLTHGIYAAVPGVTIVNNIAACVDGDGITSWHAARNLTIANNLSTRNGGAGVLVGSGDGGAGPRGHTRTVVSNNILYGNTLASFRETSDGRRPAGAGNRFLRNLAFPGPAFGPVSAAAMWPYSLEASAWSADADPCSLAAFGAVMQLARTNAAVDSGTTVGAPRHDFNGLRRPQGLGVDVGPFERPALRGDAD